MKIFPQSDLLNKLPQQFFAKLVKDVEAVKNAGHHVINLGQGSPDLPTPEHIVKKLQDAATEPLHHKYSPFRGYASLKEAVSTFYKREYGVTVDPESEVAILFGGKAGLVELPPSLLNPGDTVLVPDPGYPDYMSGVALAGANTHMMPLLEHNRFLPDYSLIAKDVASDAKLMFLNYPNNPTGATADQAFFEETIRFANTHDICVVHDFAYGAIGFDGKKPTSFLQAEGAKNVGIEIYTLSKTYNMAGWRVGFAVGNPSVIESLNLLQDHLYVSLFGAIQEAAITALLDTQQCVLDLVKTYEERRNILVDGLRQAGWEIEAPKGSFFAWLKVPTNETSESFSKRLLHEAHVAVAPGIGFGAHGEGYVRVGLVSSKEDIKEAVSRLSKLSFLQKNN